MASKKNNKITPLINSGKAELIGDRFLVKASIYSDGIHKQSIMLVVMDFLENGFSVKFFKDLESASLIIKTLQSV